MGILKKSSYAVYIYVVRQKFFITFKQAAIFHSFIFKFQENRYLWLGTVGK